MSLLNLKIETITRLVAHTIHPKTTTESAYSNHSPTLLNFSSAEKTMLVKRLMTALVGNNKTFKLEFEDQSQGSIYNFLEERMPVDEEDFLRYSQVLADDLADAHFRTNIPGGYCLVGEGQTDQNQHFFFVVKAELQEVFNIENNQLQLVKDVFLSPAKDFYKVGFFLNEGGRYVPYMYDDLFSPQKKDLTEYFYGKFLGLTTDKNDSLLSKNFYTDARNFIEENVENAADRLGLLRALTVVYREDTSGILAPRDFSNSYIEGELKDQFDRSVVGKYPMSFVKDVSLIDRRLELNRVTIPLQYALQIVGSSYSMEEVEVVDTPNSESLDRIIPEVNNGKVRQMVLIKERSNSQSVDVED